MKEDMRMTSYERVLASLRHKEPDRIPFDLGACVLTGMNVGAYRALIKYLGLPEREIRIQDMAQQLARVDDDGVTTGVVFHEDILEELVGEVRDAMQRGQLR